MSDTLLRVGFENLLSGCRKRIWEKGIRQSGRRSYLLQKGEVFGIVGESGCGKSTLGRGVCKLENLTSGHVYGWRRYYRIQ